MRTIADAPFVTYAVPLKSGSISESYWRSNASVAAIADTFRHKSVKAVTKAAGEARLTGVICRHCKQEVVVKSRGQARSVLQQFEACERYGKNKIECAPCFRIERDRRFFERERMFRTPAVMPAPVPITKQPRTKKSVVPSQVLKEEFYKSWDWRTLRMEVLKEQGRACQCCGATPGMKTTAGDPVRICVDHIKPISKFWHLRLVKTNLQILCDECNQGKGNWDETDFRPAKAPDEWVIEDSDVDPAILKQLSIHGETIQ